MATKPIKRTRSTQEETVLASIWLSANKEQAENMTAKEVINALSEATTVRGDRSVKWIESVGATVGIKFKPPAEQGISPKRAKAMIDDLESRLEPRLDGAAQYSKETRTQVLALKNRQDALHDKYVQVTDKVRALMETLELATQRVDELEKRCEELEATYVSST